MAFEDLNVEEMAKNFIDNGDVYEGYVLILLQQIREELRGIK